MNAEHLKLIVSEHNSTPDGGRGARKKPGKETRREYFLYAAAQSITGNAKAQRRLAPSAFPVYLLALQFPVQIIEDRARPAQVAKITKRAQCHSPLKIFLNISMKPTAVSQMPANSKPLCLPR